MDYTPRTADDSVNVTPRHPLSDALTLVLGVGAGLAILAFVLILFADAAVSRISIETEQRWFGGMSFDGLGEAQGDVPGRDAAAALLGRLETHWNNDYRFRLGVIDDAAPNAMAFPGGLIIVTRGLLEQVQSENELAFVLAHELGHYRNRDHLRQLGRAAAIGLVFGSLTGAGNFGLGVADVTMKRFGREQESDADRFALRLVHAEYGHVDAAWRFFERLEAYDGADSVILNYVETHPRPVDRIEALKTFAREQGWPVSGTLTEWRPATANDQD